jgi:hypothetical protein
MYSLLDRHGRSKRNHHLGRDTGQYDKIMVMLTKLLGIQPEGDDDKAAMSKKEEKPSTEQMFEVVKVWKKLQE